MPADQPTILATSMGFNRARDPWRPSPFFRYAFDLAGQPIVSEAVLPDDRYRRSSIDGFYAAFADGGADTSHLSLFEKPNMPDVSAHLRGQDVIWVDRGSLANLLAV